jgi:hypothetical protein
LQVLDFPVEEIEDKCPTKEREETDKTPDLDKEKCCPNGRVGGLGVCPGSCARKKDRSRKLRVKKTPKTKVFKKRRIGQELVAERERERVA